VKYQPLNQSWANQYLSVQIVKANAAAGIITLVWTAITGQLLKHFPGWVLVQNV